MAELTISDEERLRGQVSTLKTEAIQKEEDMQRRIEAAVEKKVQEILSKVDIARINQ
jgi:hypothetical protein